MEGKKIPKTAVSEKGKEEFYHRSKVVVCESAVVDGEADPLKTRLNSARVGVGKRKKN